MDDKRKNEVVSAGIIMCGVFIGTMGVATHNSTSEIIGGTLAILGVLILILGGK